MKLANTVSLFLCLMSVKESYSSDYRPWNWISKDGIIANKIYEGLEESFMAKYGDEDYPIGAEFFKGNIELAKKSEYDAVCKVCVEHDDYSIMGAGVLIAHPQFPNKKAILTAAHLIGDMGGTYTVIFPIDKKPRKVANQIYYPKEGVDLAVISLESYPENILPAQRCDSLLSDHNDSFGHSVGYGSFLIYNSKHKFYPMEPWIYGIWIIPNSDCDRHVIANNYHLKDGNLYTRPSRTRTKKVQMPQIQHPFTNESYPLSHATPGFSGSPVFNENNEIIGINNSIDYDAKIRTHPYLTGIFGCLFYAASLYNKIEKWSQGYALGYKAHYLYGPGIVFSVLNARRWIPSPLNVTSYIGRACMVQCALNIIGGSLAKLKMFNPIYDIMDSAILTSQAVPMSKYNQRIDTYLLNINA